MARERRFVATATALVVALIGASALVGFATALFLFAQSGASRDAFRLSFGGVFSFSLILAVLQGLPITLVFGALTHWHFHRLGLRGSTLAGLIVGAVIGLLIVFVHSSITANVLFWSAPIGAFTGLFFWLIRRPDRDQPPAASSKATSA